MTDEGWNPYQHQVLAGEGTASLPVLLKTDSCPVRLLGPACKQGGELQTQPALRNSLRLPLYPCPHEKVSKLFSTEGQLVNIFSFASHMVSVAATQFCQCAQKAATDDT